MNMQCSKCGALHFDAEKLTSSTRREAKFGSCCLEGQIRLPEFRPPPADLKNLYNGTNPHSKVFKENIRQYNAAFAFTSLGVNIDRSVTGTAGVYSFRINGELHHLGGALLPSPGETPRYAQLYIHDPVAQADARGRNNPSLNSAIMTQIQGVLNETHPYVPLYKQAFDIMRDTPAEERQDVRIRLRADRDKDLRRYNLPTANDEVAAIIPGDGSEQRLDHRDIILRLQGGGLRRISHLHPSYSSLHYVLLFPHGEDGWHTDIPSHVEGGRRVQSEKVSQRCYYAHRLHSRPGEQPLLFWGGNLFQQYVVDAWASVDQSNLMCV